MIEVRSVEKSYPSDSGAPPTPVLRGVSIVVKRGEFLALMGSSGSGKTTLLNLIGGLDAPDRGEILLAGKTLHTMDEDARSDFRLHSVGFVFQFFNLMPNLTVLENIALPMLLQGRSERDSRAAAADIAAEVGLAEKTSRMAHQLSGGEMQRVALARALVHRPAVLLADEPTGNLDSKTGSTILDLIRSVTLSHNVTVLMATHDHGGATCADRIIHMSDGLVVDESRA
jgi:putative ABC transport system ATP-binding protein